MHSLDFVYKLSDRIVVTECFVREFMHKSPQVYAEREIKPTKHRIDDLRGEPIISVGSVLTINILQNY